MSDRLARNIALELKLQRAISISTWRIQDYLRSYAIEASTASALLFFAVAEHDSLELLLNVPPDEVNMLDSHVAAVQVHGDSGSSTENYPHAGNPGRI